MLAFAGDMPAPETLALDVSPEKQERVVLERNDGSHSVTLLKDGENAGIKDITEKQYAKWLTELRKHLRPVHDKSCGEPYKWTSSKGPSKSEYAFCPEESARFKALAKTMREIRALFGND